MTLMHATAVDYKGHGILLTGDSGSGKSDTALRLIKKEAVLVADDQTELTVKDNRLTASCPEKIKGLLEINGIGIIKFPHIEKTEIKIIIRLVEKSKIERMPEDVFTEINGIKIRQFDIYPFEVSAIEKILMALDIATGKAEKIT